MALAICFPVTKSRIWGRRKSSKNVEHYFVVVVEWFYSFPATNLSLQTENIAAEKHSLSRRTTTEQVEFSELFPSIFQFCRSERNDVMMHFVFKANEQKLSAMPDARGKWWTLPAYTELRFGWNPQQFLVGAGLFMCYWKCVRMVRFFRETFR